jgi:hypothetical protein
VDGRKFFRSWGRPVSARRSWRSDFFERALQARPERLFVFSISVFSISGMNRASDKGGVGFGVFDVHFAGGRGGSEAVEELA